MVSRRLIHGGIPLALLVVGGALRRWPCLLPSVVPLRELSVLARRLAPEGGGDRERLLPSVVPLREFSVLARRLAPEGGGDRKRLLPRALEILLGEGIRILRADPALPPSRLDARFARFRKALPPQNHAGEGWRPEWFDSFSVKAARQGAHVAIAANYGTASRLAIWDEGAGTRLRVPPEMDWGDEWYQYPTFLGDGTLVVVQQAVGAGGSGTPCYVYVLYPTSDGLAYGTTWSMHYYQPWETESLRIAGDRLVFTDWEAHTWFWECARWRPLRHERVYRVARGSVRWASASVAQRDLRFADAWMAAAYRAKRPNPLQARLRAFIPKPVVKQWPVVTRLGEGQLAITVTCPSGAARLLVRWAAGGYRVEGVEPAGKAVPHKGS